MHLIARILKSSKALKIIAALILVTICIVPGSKAGLLNGLPLSYIEVALLLFVLLGIFFTQWEKIEKLRTIVILSLFVFLFLQLLSWKFLPSGWTICVYSEASNPKMETPCEPSVENPRGDYSFVYQEIDFSPEKKNMPLYFINNAKRLGFYRPGEPKRSSLPFNIESSTYVKAGQGNFLRVRSDNDLTVKINEKTFIAEGNKKTFKIPLEPDSVNYIKVNYPGIVKDDNRIIQASVDGQPFYKNIGYFPESLVNIYKFINYFLLTALAACFAYAHFLSFSELKKKSKVLIIILALTPIIPASFFLFGLLSGKVLTIYFHSAIIFSAFVFIFTEKTERKKIFPFILIVMMVVSGILATSRVFPEETIVFSGGNDELSHEYFSRQFIPVTNFDQFIRAAGNEVFYFQPLQRYFLFFLHKFLGESMWGPYFIQSFLFSMAIVFLIYSLRYSFGKISAISFSALYFGLFAINVDHNITRLLLSPLQQALALPLFILGTALLIYLARYRENGNKLWIILGLIMGAVFMMRTDWFPMILILMLLPIYFLISGPYSGKAKKAGFLAAGFAIFVLFIGFRNYYVAHQFAIFTTSTSVNLKFEIAQAISGKIREWASSAEIMGVIFASFSGKYGELIKILWGNINQNIIGQFIFQRLLWYTLPVFIILATTAAILRKRWNAFIIQSVLLISLLSMTAIGSFFKQHNGIAMIGIYNFILILILSLNIQTMLNFPEKINFQAKKIVSAIKKYKFKSITNGN